MSFFRFILVKYIAIVLLLLLVGQLFSQVKSYRFEHLTNENGLSENTVYCSMQDNKGFMWFGTQDGLNRFDGYKFIVYKETEDENSLSDIHVKCLAKDWNGDLWIGTENGLNLFLPETNSFKRYFSHPESSNSISSNNIRGMFVCKHQQDRHFWITTENGLNLFYPESGIFENYFHDPDNYNSISNNVITALYEDSYGILWIGTMHGIDQYNISENMFQHYYYDDNNELSLSSNNILSLTEDMKGNIWIGTENGLNVWDRKTKIISRIEGPSTRKNNMITSLWKDHNNTLWVGTKDFGISYLDYLTGRFISFRNEQGASKTISSNYVHSIYEDNKGILWVGTSVGGVNKTDLYSKEFYIIKCPSETESKITSNDIRSLYKDDDGFLWIGTMGGGMFKYNLSEQTFVQYTKSPENGYGLNSNFIRMIMPFREGKLWIGTEDGGVNVFDKKTGKCIYYMHDENDPNSLSNNSIRRILQDHLGVIWIGTYGGGLNRFNSEDKSFTHFEYDSENPNSLRDNRIYSLYEDSRNVLWVGTDGGGLCMFDRKTEKFINYQSDKKDRNTISDNYILAIKEDGFGRLWLGTDRGVNMMDRETETFTRILEQEGLPNNVVYAILDDRFGNVWISTNRGIACINPDNKEINTYEINDGLQDNEFNGGAYFQTKGDTIFFGGINGISMFVPEKIQNNKYLPDIVLTDLKIFNQSIKIGDIVEGKVILSKSIEETKFVNLSYKHNMFSIEFAALHYTNPDKNQYAYFLEGFDKQWNEVGSQRYAIYTNIPYGKYVFKVKASNNDGIWMEKPISIGLNISPPFWRTNWFIILFVIIISGSIYYLYRSRINKIKEQNILLERKVKERTAEVVKQKNEIEKQSKELAKLSVVASETENSITILDAKGNFEWVNDGFTRLHGYKLDEYARIKGGNLINSSTNPDIKKKVQHCVNKKVPVIYESYNISKSNEKIWTQTTLSPILGEDGNVSKLITIEADIRKIKEYENEIATQRDELVKANNTKDKFFSVISHDLRSPFNAMLGFAEILADNLNTLSKEKVVSYISEIYNSAKNLHNLVENLLVWSRSKSNKINSYPERLNLQEVITNAFSIVRISASQKAIEIIVSNESDTYVYADQNLLETVVRNLLSNAIKFSEEDSVIEILTQVGKEFVEISVSDSGVGMNKDDLKVIFREDVHFTKLGTKEEKGTGLGLILCKEFVERNGGEISVNSEPGVGTIFIFTIPVYKNQSKNKKS